jgi:hypothetical protein
VPAVLSRAPATIGLVLWTLLVWTTRITNIWADDTLDTTGKAGRTVLALSFTVLALAAGWALVRRSERVRPVVVVLAAWTTGVWIVRAVGIAAGDRDAAFVAVHVVLAAVSIGLAALAVRERAADDRVEA